MGDFHSLEASLKQWWVSDWVTIGHQIRFGGVLYVFAKWRLFYYRLPTAYLAEYKFNSLFHHLCNNNSFFASRRCWSRGAELSSTLRRRKMTTTKERIKYRGMFLLQLLLLIIIILLLTMMTKTHLAPLFGMNSFWRRHLRILLLRSPQRNHRHHRLHRQPQRLWRIEGIKVSKT